MAIVSVEPARVALIPVARAPFELSALDIDDVDLAFVDRPTRDFDSPSA
jgi:hypothetical protein